MRQRIAVIGAGIIGCLAAREIVERFPKAQVTLIDRDLPGLGASQRSAGVHFPIGTTERIRKMTEFCEVYYTALARAMPYLRFHAIDLYAVVSSQFEPVFRERLVEREGNGARVRSTNNCSLLPWPRGFILLDLPGSHYTNVGALVRFLSHPLRGQATLMDGVTVELMSERPDGVTITLGTGDTLEVDRAVLAPGPWVNAEGWRELTEPLGVRVKKVVAFHLDEPITPNAPGMIFPEEDAFIVPMRDQGHWLYSYTNTEWDVAPDNLHCGISDSNRREALDILRAYVPDRAPQIRAGRVFCDAYSPNREPIVTALGQTKNIIFAGAANGSGYRLAPSIAVEAVQLLE
jgi:glycine/D-amino acid oxidase-like deaminating enzyme